ncbi:hypothetical protein [Hyphomicrobium sp. 802]|uniref:hypothetical protein n=1 Tax=Hyphomicrobium sp. 802 TaxID=1112272 RepID=UPI00045E80B5|nr:hypothetical protein [Hyphomicrobium sp. 802]
MFDGIYSYLPNLGWLFDGSEHTLRLWEVSGVWVSSLATIAAVVAALWLGLRGEKISLAVSANVMVLVGLPGKQPEYLVVKIINKAIRPVRVTMIGWTAGYFRWGRAKKKFFYQTLGNTGYDSKLPAELRDGDEAVYYLDPKLISQQLAKDLPNSAYRRTLRIVVYPSHGRPFSARPSQSFLDMIEPPADEKQQAGPFSFLKFKRS